MRFSQEVIELPKINIPSEIKVAMICAPEAISGLVSSHVASPVSQDISNFARHLSARAKSCLSKLGLKRVTASLFVSTATNQYWGFNKKGDLCRLLVSDKVTDGTIDAFGPDFTDLASAYSIGRLEASMI